jgi:hypothetical protein
MTPSSQETESPGNAGRFRGALGGFFLSRPSQQIGRHLARTQPHRLAVAGLARVLAVGGRPNDLGSFAIGLIGAVEDLV